MTRRLIASDEAKPAKGQHKHPCGDCPLARTSAGGWLGGSTAEEWLALLHGESPINCHVLEGAQCAGAGVYRSNVCKSPRNKLLLVLPADRLVVFGSADEFRAHHTLTPVSK